MMTVSVCEVVWVAQRARRILVNFFIIFVPKVGDWVDNKQKIGIKLNKNKTKIKNKIFNKKIIKN